MEKKTAHYLLSTVKKLVNENRVSATASALANAAQLGFDFEDMKEVIRNLEMGDLYKSMTSHRDPSVWQDVYHYPSKMLGSFM